MTTKLFPSVPRTDFGPPPPGYIPGLGRGAIGFTTRSDIGPARPMAEDLHGGRGRNIPIPQLPALYAARGTPSVSEGPNAGAAAAAASSSGATSKESEDAEIAKYSDSNFDEFSGYENEQLFATGEYDAEDKEADAIYDAIDRRMDSRRKRRREELLKAELERSSKMPAIQKQFAEIKRTLKDIPLEEWEAIPEPLDYSRQNKLQKDLREKFTPVPDMVLSNKSLPQLNSGSTVVDDPMDGSSSVAASASASSAAASVGGLAPDLTSIGRARDKMLSMKLDRMADSVSGQTVVDPKGYMTQLAQNQASNTTEVSDVKKARLLLRSVIQTNPKHGPGWIAAARLEKETGKLSQARQIMMKACEMAPLDEDVWVEAAALQTPQNARAILAKAVTHLPGSVNIWLMAANLESEVDSQKAVLRRALEHLPTSVRLWKTAVSLEQPDDARILLSRAVELIPDSVEMWLALAKLESYEQARIVLNRARKAIPTDASIWLTAARLEEAQGNISNVDLIVSKAVKSLAKFQVVIDRDSWLTAACECDAAGAPVTCESIVRHTIGLGVEELDRKLTWTNDAVTMEAKGAFGVARAIAKHLCQTFPTKKSVWIKAAQLEKAHGTPESLDALLGNAVKAVPTAEILWLMWAKETWIRGDVGAARQILNNAFEINKDSEEIWLAAVKLEYETGADERARILLGKARQSANTDRVWMKSVKLERLLGNREREAELLNEALQRFPSSYKLHLMHIQMLSRRLGTALNPADIDKAREACKLAIRQVGNSNVDVWILYAKFELEIGLKNQASKQNHHVPIVKQENAPAPADNQVAASSMLASNPYAKARSILESARLKMSREPRLWLEAIRLELQSGNKKSAEWLLAKALKDLPTSGLLWHIAIALEDRPKKKSRSIEALERCPEDAIALLAAAKLFWLERKLANARKWFQRAVEANSDLGDVWLYYYKFELEHGNAEQQAAVLAKCVAAEPAHGEVWQSVSKDDRFAKYKTDQILKFGVTELPADLFSAFVPSI